MHVLVGRARDRYRWHTVATLREPGFETDRWIGNACITGSGRRAVVVYAPRQFTNSPALFERGAFAAVVDLTSGSVTKLNVGASLAYYNPGCGAAENVVLAQRGTGIGRTRLHWIDTEAAKITRRVELKENVSSAVPVGDRIVTATSPGLVAIDPDGVRSTFAMTHGLAFGVHPDAVGGVIFMEQHGSTGVVRRAHRGRTAELGRGALDQIQTWAGSGGRVFFASRSRTTSRLPASVAKVAAGPRAELSATGAVAVLHRAVRPGERVVDAAASAQGKPAVVRLRTMALSTRRYIEDTVRPVAAVEQSVVRVRAGSAETATAGSPTDPVDSDRTCAVPRNDSRTQVYQPHWRQVEWAANLAVQRGLTFTRPANWKQSGLPAWSPQGMIEWVEIEGEGRVPAQIMLGILAQESNLWQASAHAVEGVPGNPLVGNFYGLDYDRTSNDYFRIDWSRSDCGYGVAQVTDGMRLSSTTRGATEKRAIALDYATNVAAGLNILQKKWNQTRQAGIVINDGDPRWLENWFAALWAYNTGMNPGPKTGNTTGCTPGPTCADADGNWGLGYTNNPANADYPRNRAPFLELTYDDARHPQDWSYAEKVLGWAAHPIVKTELSTGATSEGFKWAWWLTNEDRYRVKPPNDLFCSDSGETNNHCDYDRAGEPCTRTDFHCWWHSPAAWKNCSAQCGHESLRYEPGDPEPPAAQNYLPNCSTDTLPGNVMIIDDVPDSVPTMRPGCGHPFTNAGTFRLRFNPDSEGHYRGKVDFHQIGGGFAGHFWFAHTRQHETDATGLMRVDGTWTLNRELHGWARVMVHIPDHGAHTQQARYEVNLGNGTTKPRVILQRTQRHEWVSLGAFNFAGTPSVKLSTVTKDGEGIEDIAWDAIAFQPLPSKPRHQIVAMGDSYSSGEGASADARFDYYQETDDDGDKVRGYNPGDPNYPWRFGNACHRSRHAWSRQASMADKTDTPIGRRADYWDTSMDFHFIACSGAETENILPPGVKNTFDQYGKGKYRELSQLERGFLDDNTTLVTFSIGGNDARFGKILDFCAKTLYCPNNVYEDDGETLDFAERALIQGDVTDSVEVVVKQVHLAAPKAKIVLMAYPRLFDGAPGSCMAGAISENEVRWVHDMVDVLVESYRTMVNRLRSEGIPVTLSDPRAAFRGHGACAEPNEAEHIHAIVTDKTQGENPDSAVSQQTMHPKITGNADYAGAFETTLRSLGL